MKLYQSAKIRLKCMKSWNHFGQSGVTAQVTCSNVGPVQLKKNNWISGGRFVYELRVRTRCVFTGRFMDCRGGHQGASCSSWLIIHTVVGGDTGDGVHIVFVGTDRLAAFMDSFPLKIKTDRQKDSGVLVKSQHLLPHWLRVWRKM